MLRARSNLLCGVAGAVTFLVAPLAVVERTQAACAPPTSTATPANNTTVTCTGTTTNANPPNGWGTGVETGDTINVQAGATVSGTSAGISVNDATINNQGVTGAASTIEATGPAGIGISAAGQITVGNSSASTIIGSAFAIKSGDSASVTNAGTITTSGANSIAIFGLAGATINNTATGRIAGDVGAINTVGAANIVNAGTIQANGTAISGTTVTLDNSGSITADIPTTVANPSAVEGVGNVVVTANSGTIQSSANAGNAISSKLGAVSLNNLASGAVLALGAGSFAVNAATDANVSNAGTIAALDSNGTAVFGANSATVDNTGLIRAPGGGGIAIKTGAGGTATVSNTGAGEITADHFAISAGTVNVTANSGLIEATGPNGFAINATTTATVTNSGTIRANAAGGVAIFTVDTVTTNSGTIEANGAGGVAIFAPGNANISNTGGVIQAAGPAIVTGNVTLNNAGTVQSASGVALASSGLATVTNLAGGLITGGGMGILATTLNVTNASGGTINGGTSGIVGSGTVTNAGTISGGTSSVSFNGAGTNTLTLQTGSVLNGDSVGSTTAGATNKLILQGSGTVDNHFTGFNTLDVEASGTWVWNSNSAIDATTVNSGTLVVDNVLASPVSVNVNSGGTLGGHGIISGDISVASGGTVAPGAAVPFSTLTVLGTVSFQPGSVFRVNADATGKNDRLAITGSATLTGGTVNVLAGGSFVPSSSITYTILTTTNVNGLGGTTFTGVTTSLAFLTPSLSYDPNNVFLTLALASTGGGGPGTNGFGFANVALTRNQRAVAGALDVSPVSDPLVIKLLNQTVAGALQAFDALSGEVYASVHNTQAEEALFVRSAILGRMRQGSYAGAAGELGALGFGGPQLAYAAGDGNAALASNTALAASYPIKAAPGARERTRDLTFWAQGLGGWGHADTDGNAASLTSRFGGFLSGVDARFGETLRAGLVAGYVRSNLNVDARSSSAGIDSIQLGAYASGNVGVFNVRGGGSYSFDSIDTSRAIFFPGFTDKASARFHGNVGQVFGEVGYGMTWGRFAVEPLAGLAYVHVHDNSFLESGGVAALTGARGNENLGYSFLGVRAATFVPLANGTVLIPRGSLQWQHAFGDVTPTTALAFQGTGAGFTVAGIPIARDAALVEGGFDWRFAPQAKLGAFYQGDLAAHAQTHAVKGTFTWDF